MAYQCGKALKGAFFVWGFRASIIDLTLDNSMEEYMRRDDDRQAGDSPAGTS